MTPASTAGRPSDRIMGTAGAIAVINAPGATHGAPHHPADAGPWLMHDRWSAARRELWSCCCPCPVRTRAAATDDSAAADHRQIPCRTLASCRQVSDVTSRRQEFHSGRRQTGPTQRTRQDAHAGAIAHGHGPHASRGARSRPSASQDLSARLLGQRAAIRDVTHLLARAPRLTNWLDPELRPRDRYHVVDSG
jgi:hypothetical protein